MLKFSSSLVFVMICAASFAQSANITMVSWAEKPAISTPDAKYNNESAVYLLDERRIEYTDEDKDMFMYKTYHRIIHVNDDKGIESFNKIYLSLSRDAKLIAVKARTILPNGKIIDLQADEIKDFTDEEGNPYKIFALSGLVKGCEVEYFYTFKRSVTFFGQEIIQSQVPLVSGKLEIITPKRLVFDVLPVNDGAKATDTADENRRVISIELKNIPGAEDEKYSNYTANLKRVEYKLSYNTSRNANQRLYTWNELAKRVYENYTTLSEKENKKTESLLDEMKVRQLATEKEKIAAIENYVKKNYATRSDVGGDDVEKIDQIAKNRIASELGIMRLYGALFEKLAIPFQYVLSGDRSDFTVDKNFENWNSTDHPLIYFPNQKSYLAPTRSDYRFPWFAPEWGNTLALHMNGTTIGNFKTAIGEVRQVPLEEYDKSCHNMEVKLKIDPKTDSVNIDIKQIFKGYSASPYRAAFNFSAEEEQKDILKEIVKFGTNSEHIISSKLENKEFEHFGQNTPFIIQASVRANELIERAGNKLLVKIGETIGPQVEMYQEKQRLFPIDVQFPHILDRQIEFEIPAGYKVKNPDDLIIKHEYSENNQTTMSFVSSYKLEGNVLKIHVYEDYRKTRYSLEQYENFKKVVNAAADFNKVVLVLEK